jgi:hypothetical protein
MRLAPSPSLQEVRTAVQSDVALPGVGAGAEFALLEEEGSGEAGSRRTPLEQSNGRVRNLEMDIYCETCVQLWAEYGAASARMQTVATPTWEATEARFQAASEAVRAHGAEAHKKTGTDSSD